MADIHMFKKYKVKLVGISLCLIILILSACAPLKRILPEPVVFPSSFYKNEASQEMDGIVISVDPFLVKAKTAEFPEFALLPEDIIPVFVVIENRNSPPFMIQKSDFEAISGEMKSSGLETCQFIDEAYEKAKAPYNALFLLGSACFGAGAGMVMNPTIANPFFGGALESVGVGLMFSAGANITNIQGKAINLLKKELPERTLSKGESARGVIFFNMKEAMPRTFNNLHATVTVLEAKRRTINFSIPVKVGNNER